MLYESWGVITPPEGCRKLAAKCCVYANATATGHHPVNTGAVLGWGRGHVPPDSLVAPHIQKLADRSDVISKVPKCTKIEIFRGSAPDLAGGAYRAPPEGLVSTDLRV